jgi:outer membrane protein assembly factor BamD (BamD/ComL family)
MKIVLSLFILVSILSCATGPVVIEENLTSMELVQRAQDAMDKYQYDRALQYYNAILQRFPDDMNMVCMAEYEIAFIKYKQKKYDEAKVEFQALLARYEGPDAELLPPQYKILAEKVLSKIELTKK